jgi:hypothetical protein
LRGVFLLLSCFHAACSLAQAPTVSRVEQLTENRGWNEAGIGPHYQMILSARISPAGFPTLVFAERDGVREPLTQFPQPGAPDLYVMWQRFDAAATAPWRIVAERGEAKSAPVPTPGLAKAWQVPLAKEVKVTGQGAQPRVSWALPDFGGRAIERIRVVVRGEPRVHGRFLSQLYASDDLPSAATSFAVPRGVLKPGSRYIFQVTLENVEGGAVRNRSMAFSEPYTAR